MVVLDISFICIYVVVVVVVGMEQSTGQVVEYQKKVIFTVMEFLCWRC